MVTDAHNIYFSDTFVFVLLRKNIIIKIINMKSIKVTSFTESKGLIWTEMPDPEVTQGQVLIKIDAAGVGMVDILMSKGMYPDVKEPGFIPGFEVAGTVISVADENNKAWVGKRVYAMTSFGGYAEKVAVNAEALVEIPDNVTAVDAVGLGINALVAQISLERGQFRAGQEVFIRGASGGIGSSVAVVAIANGGVVTATASSTEKDSKLKSIGVQTMSTTNSNKNLSERFDIIIDPVAGKDIANFVPLLKDNGRYIINGVAGGFPEVSFFNTFLLSFQRSLNLSFLSLNSIAIDELKGRLKDIFGMAAKGGLNPVIDEVLPLPDALKAHQRIESGSVFGKIVLISISL